MKFYLPEIDPLDFNLDTAPYELDLSGSRFGQVIVIMFGSVFVIGPLLFYLFGSDMPIPLLLVFTVVGLGMTGYGFSRYLRVVKVAFNDRYVNYLKTGLGGREEWREPYRNYLGVYLNEEKRQRSRSSSSSGSSSRSTYYVHYQIIRLKHPDDDKTIPLYVTSVTSSSSAIPDHMPAPPREKWRRYSTFFDRPLLITVDGEIREYVPQQASDRARQDYGERRYGLAPEDFDANAPVRESARQSVAATQASTQTAGATKWNRPVKMSSHERNRILQSPPAGFAITKTAWNSQLARIVEIKSKLDSGNLLLGIGFIGFAGWSWGTAWLASGQLWPDIISMAVGGFGLYWLWAAIKDSWTPYQLVVTPDEVLWGYRHAQPEKGVLKRIDRRQIESVRLTDDQNQIAVATPDQRMLIGEGMSRDKLKALRDILQALL